MHKIVQLDKQSYQIDQKHNASLKKKMVKNTNLLCDPYLCALVDFVDTKISQKPLVEI